MNKARGKSGPLFNFDVHDDIRLLADARIEKDESHAGKVVVSFEISFLNLDLEMSHEIEKKDRSVLSLFLQESSFVELMTHTLTPLPLTSLFSDGHLGTWLV